jgi:ABC-type multidrug transport system fused ATPase/permease subunit
MRLRHGVLLRCARDRVLVLEYGQIIEDGAPDHLITVDGHYAGLHQAWEESLA